MYAIAVYTAVCIECYLFLLNAANQLFFVCAVLNYNLESMSKNISLKKKERLEDRLKLSRILYTNKYNNICYCLKKVINLSAKRTAGTHTQKSKQTHKILYLNRD